MTANPRIYTEGAAPKENLRVALAKVAHDPYAAAMVEVVHMSTNEFIDDCVKRDGVAKHREHLAATRGVLENLRSGLDKTKSDLEQAKAELEAVGGRMLALDDDRQNREAVIAYVEGIEARMAIAVVLAIQRKFEERPPGPRLNVQVTRDSDGEVRAVRVSNP